MTNARDDDLPARLAPLAPRLELLCRHLAGRALLRRVEVEDLVQDALVRALSARAGAPSAELGEAALVRWLTTIARHAVVDAARAARRHPRGLPRVAATTTGAVRELDPRARTAGAATRAELAEEAAHLRAAFDRLAPEHRRVLGLRQFEGLSARDTAARMGRAEAAVHSLYRRALEAWDAELGRRG